SLQEGKAGRASRLHRSGPTYREGPGKPVAPARANRAAAGNVRRYPGCASAHHPTRPAEARRTSGACAPHATLSWSSLDVARPSTMLGATLSWSKGRDDLEALERSKGRRSDGRCELSSTWR